MDRLAEDAFAQRRFERVFGHQVHSSSQYGFEPGLEAHKGKKPRSDRKVHKDVHVGIGPFLPPSERPEKRDVPDAP